MSKITKILAAAVSAVMTASVMSVSAFAEETVPETAVSSEALIDDIGNPAYTNYVKDMEKIYREKDFVEIAGGNLKHIYVEPSLLFEYEEEDGTRVFKDGCINYYVSVIDKKELDRPIDEINQFLRDNGYKAYYREANFWYYLVYDPDSTSEEHDDAMIALAREYGYKIEFNSEHTNVYLPRFSPNEEYGLCLSNWDWRTKDEEDAKIYDDGRTVYPNGIIKYADGTIEYPEGYEKNPMDMTHVVLGANDTTVMVNDVTILDQSTYRKISGTDRVLRYGDVFKSNVHCLLTSYPAQFGFEEDSKFEYLGNAKDIYENKELTVIGKNSYVTYTLKDSEGKKYTWVNEMEVPSSYGYDLEYDVDPTTVKVGDVMNCAVDYDEEDGSGKVVLPISVISRSDLPQATLKGDVDLTGEVSLSDIVVLSKYNLNNKAYPLKNDIAKANADVNGDGDIDGVDTSSLIESQVGE